MQRVGRRAWRGCMRTADGGQDSIDNTLKALEESGEAQDGQDGQDGQDSKRGPTRGDKPCPAAWNRADS